MRLRRLIRGYGFAHPQGFQYIDVSDLPKGMTDNLIGRHVIRKATLEEFIKNPDFANEEVETPASGDDALPHYQYKG